MMRSIFIAVAMVIAFAGSAAADDPAGRVIELERIYVVGERQQPEAMYVLQRSRTGYEVRDLRASFVREVIRSTEEAPF